MSVPSTWGWGSHYLLGWRRLGETGYGAHGSMWSHYLWVFIQYQSAREGMSSGQMYYMLEPRVRFGMETESESSVLWRE